jgi:hypothetical protein
MPDIALRAELWGLLQRLQPRQRAAIVLRVYEDLSEAANGRRPALLEGHGEIALLTGPGPSAVGGDTRCMIWRTR